MKIIIECAICKEIAKSTQDGTKNIVPFEKNLEFTDNFYLEYKCPLGHQLNTFIDVERYSALFDYGMFALEDGYTREAVASFTAAMERVHEFFIRAIVYKHGFSVKSLDSTWKLVGKQSERQMGAFYFLYLLETKEVPTPISNNQTEFRNDVIHKGIIPNYTKTLTYANAIHDYICKIVDYMTSNLEKEVRAVHEDNITEITQNKANNFLYLKNYIPYMTTYNKYYKMALSKKMEKRKSYRWLFPGTTSGDELEHLNPSGRTARGIMISGRLAGQRIIGDASDMEWE